MKSGTPEHQPRPRRVRNTRGREKGEMWDPSCAFRDARRKPHARTGAWGRGCHLCLLLLLVATVISLLWFEIDR
jgi:hypothetical protein